MTEEAFSISSVFPSACISFSTAAFRVYNSELRHLALSGKDLRLFAVALRLPLCRFTCEADEPADCLRID
ncbi:MAG: hypothetical protein IKQ80_06985, partial [Clostridia bacterium]|nr:hypothetical protein [Clostridia bacterium]